MFALQSYAKALSSFAASSESFLQISRVLPDSSSTRNAVADESETETKVLHVLDSSFNPPTRAHLHLAVSSLLSPPPASASHPPPTTLLLLLATQNADKPTSPASFEDRIHMMSLLARDVLTSAISQHHAKFHSNLEVPGAPPPQVHDNFNIENLAIDIALTKHALFLDKASSLRKAYPCAAERIFLLGHDTLERILDPKYYPHGDLKPVDEFFKDNTVRSTSRGAMGIGDRVEVEVMKGLDEDVSSTRVREAAKKGDGATVSNLCSGEDVAYWVESRKLYRE